MKRITVLFVTFMLLNFADLFTTMTSFNYTIYVELNTVIAFLYDRSPFLMAFYKILGPSLPFIVLQNFDARTRIQKVIYLSTIVGLALATLVYGLIVVHNILLLGTI
ncbi:DUF5658 family protein [Archaeoglobus sulfaticallidus]|uniref:DUF5658 family protein n=1 Tax=Archaeoglobus sulfaticallidus TaxID=1316941 RepID=UPI001181981A|nr:DUF5658 family protein [Archaeoglobus sulfaticallidus]